MSKEVRGRALCRQFVRERTDPRKFARIIKERAARGDSELGQVLAHLTASSSPNAQLNGLDSYVYVMAATGNHERAIRVASTRAGLVWPGEDLGPVDYLCDKVMAWLDRNRYFAGKTARPNPVGRRPQD